MTLAGLAANDPFDVTVIGGGINGCAIAAELARSGKRVALFEAADFGFGTTWRSTKLIHGGLRYLEHGDVRLVRESLRERSWLLHTRPYLVTPQRFLLPMLPWSRRPGWQLRVGLAAYDLLAWSNTVPKHRGISKGRMRELMPSLSDVAEGGFSFYDARVHAPERLALELALEAQAHGAAIANHAKVTKVLVAGGRVEGVEINGSYTVATSAVINAAGPWVDAVNAGGGLPGTELLSVTRGAHIVVELDEPPGRDAVFSTAKSDGRVFFAVPQGPLLLVGTTDDRYEGEPSAVRPTETEVDYLVEEAQELLPGLDISRARIRYAYAGLRPLQRVSGGPEAAISRRHDVVDHARHGGPQGMYSVVGGKLSTFKPLAEEVASRLGVSARKTRNITPVAPGWAQVLRESPLSLHQKQHLRVYGPSIGDVLSAGMEPLCEHAGAVTGEVRYVSRMEQVTTLADIMMRRTGISWSSCRGLCCAEEVAAIAAETLGWGVAERQQQVVAFREELDFHLPRPAAIDGALM